jgi:hypothetical protein
VALELVTDLELIMDPELLAARLAETAESVGIEVRQGPAELDGAAVVLRGDKVVFVPAGALPTKKVEILARALAGENLEAVFLLPAVREAIENARGGED